MVGYLVTRTFTNGQHNQEGGLSFEPSDRQEQMSIFSGEKNSTENTNGDSEREKWENEKFPFGDTYIGNGGYNKTLEIPVQMTRAPLPPLAQLNTTPKLGV